jgi:hypothetical protein
VYLFEITEGPYRFSVSASIQEKNIFNYIAIGRKPIELVTFVCLIFFVEASEFEI